MKMKLFILFSCLSIAFCVDGQSLSLSHLSTASDISSSGEVSLQWTLGELAATTQLGENLMLTEGFLQPSIRIHKLPQVATRNQGAPIKEQLEVEVYPSPVTDYLNIDLKTESTEPVNLTIHDLSGQKIRTRTLDQMQSLHRMNLTSLSAGEYILKFSGTDGADKGTFIIIKM